MKEKIQISIDVNKIDKKRIVERKYMKDGVEITQKIYKIEVIPIAEAFVTEGPTWKMIKTHFVAEAVTKEERANKIRGTVLGDGVVLRNKEHGVDMGTEQPTEITLKKPAGYPSEEPSDNIPF